MGTTEVTGRTREGMARRLTRALRLDSTLYREATSPGSGVWQATAVIVIMAVISQIRWGTAWFVDSVGSDTDGMDIGAAIAQSSIPSAVITGLAYLAAWPVWAAGFWIVGTLWGTSSRPPPRFGHVARALAFAQVPAFLGVLYVLLVVIVGLAGGAEGLRSGFFWLTGFWLSAAIGAWVLAGTFLAVREALGFSNARTLAALVAVGLVIAALLGLVVVLLSGVAGREFVGLHDDGAGFTQDGASALNFAIGLDFNLRFFGRSDTVLLILSESVLHPLSD